MVFCLLIFGGCWLVLVLEASFLGFLIVDFILVLVNFGFEDQFWGFILMVLSGFG